MTRYRLAKIGLLISMVGAALTFVGAAFGCPISEF
jgi:hypothetical protein